MHKKQPWRIERRVPMAIVLTLLMQIAVIIAWATQLDARVTHLEAFGAAQREVGENIARLQERLESVKRELHDMRQQLDRLAEHLLPPGKR